MADNQYVNRIVAESCRVDGQVNLRVTFEQFFEENAPQVDHLVSVFPKVAEAVGIAGAEFGQADLARRGKK